MRFMMAIASLVLLAGPRRRLAQNVETRVEARRASRSDLDARLDPKSDE